ncbi:hypothetical protein ID866_4062 [Astraeus odoratus]|nr:hypothetical protein ID866_4062 [Astraeus odoratus]
MHTVVAPSPVTRLYLEMTLRLYIVRHGETDWNRERRIQGQLDVPLNETGMAQAALVAQALKDVHFVRAHTSDLQRACKTAETILQHHPGIELVKDEALRERYMGELEGELANAVKSAPSKETMDAMVGRCQAWYMHSIVEYMSSKIKRSIPVTGRPESILVVSHGALISTLVRMLVADRVVVCGKGVFIGHCWNTGVSIIDYPMRRGERDRSFMGTLTRYSDVSHLVRTQHVEENADELVQ